MKPSGFLKPLISCLVFAAVIAAIVILLNSFEILGAVVTGLIFAIMAIGVFITFRVLNLADMSVDGTFTTGAAVSAVLCMASHPYLGIFMSFIVGGIAGCITAFLHTKLKIQPLLAGIITMTGLYSINLRIMGAANKQLLSYDTVFKNIQDFLDNASKNTHSPFIKNLAENYLSGISALIPAVLTAIIVLVLLNLFLNTEIGFALRATGDNPDMVRSQGISTTIAEFIGYSISNGLVALSGALFAQYQGFADISMGIGTVTIGLASVIIGEAAFALLCMIFGKFILKGKKMAFLLISVVIGAVAYRFIYAIALNVNLNPNDMKLMTALIVALALSGSVINSNVKKLMKKIKPGKSA